MAAPGLVSSRAVQREERASSARSSFTLRTPAPTVSAVSPEQLVSPGQGAESPGRSLWEQICAEYEAELPPFPEGYKAQPDAATALAPQEETAFHRIKTEHIYSVPQLTRDSHTSCTQVKLETVDPKTCSPREFLETFIFPVLLPGMASLLRQAEKERCFERKRTKFIACDFLTEWLYNHNPKRTAAPFTEFFSIPFVAQWLAQHPRPPAPLSLLLTEVEAALHIQAFWRAYLVRCDAEIQELRQWQKKLREEEHIRQRVRAFWVKQEQKVKCKMEEEEEAAAVARTPAP